MIAFVFYLWLASLIFSGFSWIDIVLSHYTKFIGPFVCYLLAFMGEFSGRYKGFFNCPNCWFGEAEVVGKKIIDENGLPAYGGMDDYYYGGIMHADESTNSYSNPSEVDVYRCHKCGQEF